MTKKTAKERARRLQRQHMRRRQKEIARRKSKRSTVVSEGAIQYQMIKGFGSVENFVKNVLRLAEMFTTEEELKALRFDHAAIYAKLDPQAHREYLAGMYAQEGLFAYPEEHQEFWKEKRKEILPELLNEEFVKRVSKTLEVLARKKKGFKAEFRAVTAGKLLAESHIHALTQSPVEDNHLWEIIYNAAIKENPVELPGPAPEGEAAAGSDASSDAGAGQGQSTAGAEPDPKERTEEKTENESS